MKGRRWRLLLLLLMLAIGLTPLAMRVYYRVDHLPLILKASRDHGVSPHLIAAIIFTESKFRADARSEVGASGLMQLMPETAEDVAERLGVDDFHPDSLHDPAVNIDLGVAYVRFLQDRFHDTDLVLAAYNAGPTVVEEWQREQKPILYPETRHYIKAVRRHQGRLRHLYPEWNERVKEDPKPPAKGT